MGNYRTFGTALDRVFRNDLNTNFQDIATDIEAQKTRIDGKADISLVNELSGINDFSVTPTYNVNGQLTKVEEKEGSTVKSASTLTYNTDGTVNTITEEINGKTVVTTLNYVNGEFNNATKAVI